MAQPTHSTTCLTRPDDRERERSSEFAIDLHISETLAALLS